MSRIYTKTGDDGTTGLLGPDRVGKDDQRIEAYGTVDELNAALGVVRALPELALFFDRALARLQEELFVVGSVLADPDPNGRFQQAIDQSYVERLEQEIDAFERSLPPLQHFILPGGTMVAAQLHLARTICRRAERTVVALGRQPGEHVPPVLVVYLNRLSDFLFTLARSANHEAGVADVPWRGL